MLTIPISIFNRGYLKTFFAYDICSISILTQNTRLYFRDGSGAREQYVNVTSTRKGVEEERREVQRAPQQEEQCRLCFSSCNQPGRGEESSE